MTLAKLLRLSSAAEEHEQPPTARTPAWPYDNSMLLGIPPGEFTASVRRAIWALLGEARSLRAELERARTLLRNAEQAVDRDQLLPVLNRRAFARELDRQIASAARYSIPTSVAYLDVDGLKSTNDTHGHACGDAVLAHLSGILLSALRSSDLVGRLGGDEFGIILLHANQQEAQSTCARLVELAAGRPVDWQAAQIPVRFTFGTVQIADGMDAEGAIAAADAAMYRQKALRQ